MMKRGFRQAAIAGLLLLASPAVPQAAEIVGAASQTVALEVNKGSLIRLDRAAATVFVADPTVADIQVKSPRLVYIFARKPGETTLYAVDPNERVLANYRIEVSHNVTRLQSTLRELLPGAAIQVGSIDGALLMTGAVASPIEAEDARKMAESFLLPDQRLVNRLRVEQPNQVNVRVRIAEVSRQVVKQLGFNFDAVLSDGANFLFGLAVGDPVTLGGTQFLTRRVTSELQNTVNNAIGSIDSGNFHADALIDALEAEGLITVLAEPNLTAVSGETASFLAGGEFPIPIESALDGIEIEFKEFGVSLAFVPTVLSDGRISLRVRPEVSQLSSTGAITLNSIQIPGISTRRAETTVELGSGQSFAIAGLLQNNVTHDISKFPGLGDVPILGALFRSDRFRRDESELVIIVTPYLVRPVSAQRLMAPTDGYVPPNDTNRLLYGAQNTPQLRTAKPAPLGSGGAGLIGPNGFVIE